MPRDLTKLKSHITGPAKGRYSGKGHSEIAEAINAESGTVPRESIDTGTLRSSVTKSNFVKLKPQDSAYWLMLTGGGQIPLTDTVKAELIALFDAASESGKAIAALMFRPTTLAEELEVPGITPSDVADALRE